MSIASVFSAMQFYKNCKTIQVFHLTPVVSWIKMECFALGIHLNCSHLDEDVEIELVEDMAPFLASHSRHQLDLSPVKIVKVRGNLNQITDKCRLHAYVSRRLSSK